MHVGTRNTAEKLEIVMDFPQTTYHSSENGLPLFLFPQNRSLPYSLTLSQDFCGSQVRQTLLNAALNCTLSMTISKHLLDTFYTNS